MPDHPSDPTRGRARPTPVDRTGDAGPPPPARVEGPAPRDAGAREERGRSRGRGGARGRDGRGREGRQGSAPTRPTPVRDLARAEGPPPPCDPDADHASLAVDGSEWTVRVLGRSGGAGASAVPMLLLGFAKEHDAPVELEALVVGRTLEALTPLELETAYRGARAAAPEVESTRADRRGRRERRGGAAPRRGS